MKTIYKALLAFTAIVISTWSIAGPPPGPYRATCSNIHESSSWLIEADCATQYGTVWNPNVVHTKLHWKYCHDNHLRIYNINGQLGCNKSYEN